MHPRLPLLLPLLCAASGALAGRALAQDSTPPLPAVVLPGTPLVPGQGTGRLVGRVIDRATGRPLSGVRVQALGVAEHRETDLDGRYRYVGLAPGRYTVRALMIGYRAGQVDSVTVTAGATASADFALEGIAVELEGITVEAAAVSRPSSEAALLALQQAAPAVSDGISAEAIRRSPDNDAADAVTRVTGISVVDNRFVIVRGLPERYSSTLLNGAELVSTEPHRRVVPLDIFPASLLEALVTTKAATPDRPGDFAGGSVEIRTRDFPDQFTFQVSASQSGNSVATFHDVPLIPRRGTDLLGFDNGRRAVPADRPLQGEEGTLRTERFGEGLRNVWTPAPRRAMPGLGLSANVGGQTTLGGAPLGFIVALTWGSRTEWAPQRLFSLYNDPAAPADRSLVYAESKAVVDWGAIVNLSWRPGRGTKLGLRNMVTANAEEGVVSNTGYDTENARVVRQYQVRYIEQRFLQSQLAGEHQLGWLFGSRVEWRGTLGRARRDEPDNRQAFYILDPTDGAFAQAGVQPMQAWVRSLDDRITSLQLDWSVPFRLRTPADALFKVGALHRVRRRAFDAALFRMTVDLLAPNGRDIARLPPEQAFAPENIGEAFTLTTTGTIAQSYGARDRVGAAYGMLDFFLLRGVRIVAGLRYEDWAMDILPRGLTQANVETTLVRQPDALWSSNLTVALGARTNLRFSAFRSVARPDARELSPDSYTPTVGACEVQGNRALQRTVILNGDARFEFYRRPGEIVSASAFYKRFDNPILETVDVPGGGQCRIVFRNGLEATNYGLELDFRRTVLLPGLELGVNLTVVDSRVRIDSTLGVYDPDLPLQGQSPLLVNGSVAYTTPGGRLSVSTLLNYFSSRAVRYGTSFGQQGQGPNLLERGRTTVDAKLQLALSSRLSVSLAGKNLLDQPQEFYHESATVGDVVAGYVRPGVGFSIGLGYGL